MDNIFNWDDCVENTYINEEGRYTLKIVDFESKMTANGNECHVYVCENRDKATIKVNLYVVEKAMWKYKAFVSACGLETKGTVDLNELAPSLIGKKFIGEVKRQPDKVNVATGETEPSKYFEVVKFYKVEE